jgi:type IV pilus assembly protein PilM
MTTTPLMGVDISSSSIKVLQLSKDQGKYCLDAYTIEFLPPQNVVDKTIKAVDTVGAALRRAVKKIKNRRKLVALAVAGSSVITRVIQINKEFNDSEIIEQIEIEADRYIPYPLEEVYYDFEIMGPSLKNPDLMDVLLAAARMETVDMRVSVAEEAGLKAVIIDVETLAMEKAFSLIAEQLPHQGMGSIIAMLDIGATNTTLYIFKDLKVIYSRDQVFGGKHLTDEIQRRYGLSAEEAIAAQKYGGLPEDYVTEVLEPFKETIIQQVNRAVQVFFSSSEENAIHHMVLVGGIAALPGLDALIQNKMNIKALVGNPFANMQISPDINKSVLADDAPALMMTCGLAMRTFDSE